MMKENYCPQCDANHYDGNYCSQCGSVLVPRASKGKCLSCQADLDWDSNYCRWCGTAVKREEGMIDRNGEFYREAGRMIQKAIQAKREQPALVVLEFMKNTLDYAKVTGIEPDWGKVIKEARRLWRDDHAPIISKKEVSCEKGTNR